MRSLEDIDRELRKRPPPVKTQELIDERLEVMRSREQKEHEWRPKKP